MIQLIELIYFNIFLHKILISPKNQVQSSLVRITINNLRKNQDDLTKRDYIAPFSQSCG